MGNKKGIIPWNKGKTKETDLSVRKISETMKLKNIDNFEKWRVEAKLTGVIPESNKILKKAEAIGFRDLIRFRIYL